ncbi:MAG TPA: class I SAM-dependent methyltransferase [Candidatus Acidoferrales bacterium]|nr:class I SAM-dependent methyltransferase [Candidatus Acidoferrales bacterium]
MNSAEVQGTDAILMEQDYAKSYRELYFRHWWWRARERFVLEEIARLGLPSAGNEILDVGCGDGLFFDELSKFGNVEGVEPDRSLISEDGPQAARIHCGPFDESFHRVKKYNLILMLDVLEHLRDPVAAVRRAISLLAENGAILITVPAFRSLWTNHDTLNHHVTRFTKSTFSAVARQAGLGVETMRYFFHWLFPLKFVQRMLEMVSGSAPKLPSIPGPAASRIFYAISRIEQRAGRAAPAPFGSSLLVIGRRG